MTKLLQEAFAMASRLSPDQQDALAAIILAELEAEPAWKAALERSPGELSRLAREAVEEYRAGGTEPLEPGLV